MPAHQILSCHVTQDANFKIFYFVLILHLILGKSQISNRKALYFISYQQKTSRGGGGGGEGGTPPESQKQKVKVALTPFIGFNS